MKKILIISSLADECHYLRTILSECYTVNSCSGIEDARTILQAEPHEYILVEPAEPSQNGFRRDISSLKLCAPAARLICCGPSGRVELIVEAIKHGACYYVCKPFTAPGLKNALLQANSQKKLALCQSESSLHGDSPTMQNLRRTISLFAKHNDSVLIVGETGTGKELAANELHRLSTRYCGPFLALDCASIPENLAESILFGCEKGAYTDSVQRKGAFEQATGGTIFLDELAELPRTVQSKLLRTLETRQGTRLGSIKQLNYDVRVVSATNARQLHNSAVFRPDLLHRLETLVIEMPPLRQHPEDIPQLASHFINLFGKSLELSEAALETLINWRWPGNIRELKNVITRACILAGDRNRIDRAEIQTGSLWRWSGIQPDLL